jgi:hypothetical protein
VLRHVNAEVVSRGVPGLDETQASRSHIGIAEKVGGEAGEPISDGDDLHGKSFGAVS